MDNLKLNIFLQYIETLEHRPLAEKGVLPLREREIETIFSMGNGFIGTRNSLEEPYPESDPGSFIAGMYVQGPYDDFNFLVKAPDWTSIKIYAGDALLNLKDQNAIYHSRYIDFKRGTIVREWKNQDQEGRITDIKIIKYISLAYKNELGKLLIIKPENYSEKISVITGINCNAADFRYLLNMNCDLENYASIHMKTKYSGKEFVILQKSLFFSHCKEYARKIDYYYDIKNFYDGSFETFEWKAEPGNNYLIKTLSCLCTDKDSRTPVKTAISAYKKYERDFFDESYIKHGNKWRERFKESQIILSGNEYDQKLIDFAVYHLITAGEFSGNTHSVPARNLSGESYKGHVFWDTEMYLLPFFVFTKPEIAKALLMYRYNTLDGARKNALKEGFKGASFAWESTDSGAEEAPELVMLPNGEVVHILSGKYENHISSDIAYAVWQYWHATRDDNFLINYGAEILFETARFCKSLVKKGTDGLYHINSVIGPDEYHEIVDDNAYTNYLAANNFDIASKTYYLMNLNYPDQLKILKEKINLRENEPEEWNLYKENMYLGYDPETKLYEQFKGFYDLEYIDLKEYEPRFIPMDIILGRAKTAQTQVIKQADVLMFMMLFRERFSKEQLSVNYDFYENRCGHGSSLSPSIHSVMASAVGKTADAYRYFLKNAKIDIGDEFGNAAGGIHIASTGGVWMSVAFGFAGMCPVEKGLVFDPQLPDEWNSIEFSIKWREQTIYATLFKNEIKFFISGNKNIFLSAGFYNWREISPAVEYIAFKNNQKWEWKE
ncbi:MAG TPA: hypothetical protein P5556_08315 [Candidatus Gastranaerophilales bacterium]|nr:hypothetical protein [Candidatus Gastranaerophilales bacterium]